mmetsp:Transcript_23293/g.49244  ORF Transcript_23293/g.49244 Transcript_23293/m.49244 type:complete len:84 (-) Transcript_23293:676-927(-)
MMIGRTPSQEVEKYYGCVIQSHLFEIECQREEKSSPYAGYKFRLYHEGKRCNAQAQRDGVVLKMTVIDQKNCRLAKGNQDRPK